MGDNSSQWEVEAERIIMAHRLKNMEKVANADVLVTNNISEVKKFMLGGEDLNNLTTTTEDVAELPTVYKNAMFLFKMMTTKMLIKIANEISLQYMGAK